MAAGFPQSVAFAQFVIPPGFFISFFPSEWEKDDDSVSSFHEFRHPAYRQRSSSLPASLFGILSLPSIMSSRLCFTSAPLLYFFPVSAPYHRPPTTIHCEDVAKNKTLQPIHLRCADLPTKANTFSPNLNAFFDTHFARSPSTRSSLLQHRKYRYSFYLSPTSPSPSQKNETANLFSSPRLPDVSSNQNMLKATWSEPYSSLPPSSFFFL